VVALDALGRAQGRPRARAAALGRLELRRGDDQVPRGARREPIEARGELEQRGIAPRPHVREDLVHRCDDGGIDLGRRSLEQRHQRLQHARAAVQDAHGGLGHVETGAGADRAAPMAPMRRVTAANSSSWTPGSR
jgi:hypothetical protein